MITLIETAKIKKAIESNPQDILTIIEDTSLVIGITDQNGHYAAVKMLIARSTNIPEKI